MAITEEYKLLAKDDVDMLLVLKYIENDLQLNFKMVEGHNIFLRCPQEVYDIDKSVHESSSTSKCSLNLRTNRIKCYNPACECNKPMDTIAIIKLFYPELSFQNCVKLALEIGGFEYKSEVTELSPELKQAMLRTNYVNEKCEQLLKGYEMIEEGLKPKGRFETLYVDAAKYLLSRGITKYVARKLRFGVGGGPSSILKNNSKEVLATAKILSHEKKFELMTNRILIPNIAKGLVTGITGRAIYDDKRRYLNVGDVTNLINIDRAKKYDTIFIFEGGLNGASYEVLTGEENYVTLQGASSFKKEFLMEVIKESSKFEKNTEFVYVADNDTAGLFAAKELGMEILRLGFTLNVLVTPKSKDGKKVDVNDILRFYGKEQGLIIWNDFIKNADPFIVFAIKEEFSKLTSLNPLTLEIKKTKIIQNYLKLDFVDPNERWILEQYFSTHGYPVTSDFFKYADLHFSKPPKLDKNKLICFVGEIDPLLEENLLENEKEFNIIDISSKTNIFELDSRVQIILITNSLFLFKTKKLYEILSASGHSVKIHYSDKPITSLIEYVYAVSKSIDGKKVFEELSQKNKKV